MFPIPFLLLILAIATGGAVVGVSDSAAPGDPLYGIDRSVEAFRLRMTTDTQNLLELQEKYHEERLEEIQQLVARGAPDEFEQALDNLEQSLADMTPTPYMPASEPDDEPVEEGGKENLGFYCRNVDNESARKHPTGESLAGELGVEYGVVMDKACSGFGFGGIRLAYQISALTGLDVEQIFALKAGGMGWGQILAQYGLEGLLPEEELPGEEEPGEEEPGEEGPEEEGKQGAYCSGAASKQHPTGAKLAERYQVTYEEVMGWFCDYSYGFGEIDLAYTIRNFKLLSGEDIPVTDIFNKRAEGMGWGNIMKEYGLGGKNGQPPGQVKLKNNKGKGNPGVQPQGQPGKKPKPTPKPKK